MRGGGRPLPDGDGEGRGGASVGSRSGWGVRRDRRGGRRGVGEIGVADGARWPREEASRGTTGDGALPLWRAGELYGMKNTQFQP